MIEARYYSWLIYEIEMGITQSDIRVEAMDDVRARFSQILFGITSPVFK
jgi:hypothetical protein